MGFKLWYGSLEAFRQFSLRFIKGVLLAEIFEIEILEFLNRVGSKATSVSFCQMTALECFADA